MMIARIFRFLFPLFIIGSLGFLAYWIWGNYDQLPEKKEIVSTKIKEFTNLGRSTNTPTNTVALKVGNEAFFVEVVKTQSGRQKGLMFRESLPQNQGMFFVFDSTDIYNFWMPNVNFPLDIVWIDQGFKVVDIKTAPPCTEKNIQKCPSYKPNGMAKYVLEVNANTFEGVVGDIVTIQLNQTIAR